MINTNILPELAAVMRFFIRSLVSCVFLVAVFGALPRVVKTFAPGAAQQQMKPDGRVSKQRQLKAVPGKDAFSPAVSAAAVTCAGTTTNTTCNSGPGITLNSTGNALHTNPALGNPYPSNNVVSGLNGTISSISVRLNNLSSDFLNDIDMALVSPSGTVFVFFSDIGGASPIANQTITLSDNGANALPATGLIVGGTYKPTNNQALSNNPDIFTGAGFTTSATNSAAPIGNQTFATRFNGENPNGTWKLYTSISLGPDTGSLGSWDLLIATEANVAATTTTLTSSNNPALIPTSGNSTGTITATVVSGGNPVTSGSVTFVDLNTTLASGVNVDANGQASFTFNTNTGTPILSEGVHTITATYSGAPGFGQSSTTLMQTVDRATLITGNTFCNTGRIGVPYLTTDQASVYPSKLFVTGLSGLTQTVSLKIDGYTNPQSEDMNLLLVSPTGQKFIPFAYISDTTATNGAVILLSDSASNTFVNSGAIASGTYRPSYGLFGLGLGFLAASFPSPAPIGPYNEPAPKGIATFSSVFAGANPNGTWTLYVANGGGGGPVGTKEITNGWCLTIGTTNDPASTTTVSVTPTPSTVTQQVTISALVTDSSNGNPVNGQGTVTFREGNTVLAGPLVVGSNGVASFTKSDFGQGAHTITANYSGSPGFFALSSGQALHYVDAVTSNPSGLMFCNSTPITIPNAVNGSGSPYPTRINVSGLAGTIGKVTLTLNKFTHQFPDDVDLMLTGPNGKSIKIFSDVGGSTPVSNLDITLDDAGANLLPDGNVLNSGIFHPTDINDGTDTFASPAPTTNILSANASVGFADAFGGIDPNGTWTLWVANDNAGAAGGGSIGGGWCLNLTVNQPQLTVTKSHIGNFTQGGTGSFDITVGNAGLGSTAGTISVTDTTPAGMSITSMSGNGWTCTTNTQTCTSTSAIASGGTLPPITVNVAIASNAGTPLLNQVAVSGGGSLGASTSDSVVINPVPDLTISKTTSSTFFQGGTAIYILTVTNIGGAVTSGTYTISDSLPPGLTASSVVGQNGLTCNVSGQSMVSCSSSTPLASGSSISAMVNVDIAANAPSQVMNTATVSGGGDISTGNNFSTVTSPVTAQVLVSINVPAGITFTFNGIAYTGSQQNILTPVGQRLLSTSSTQALGAGSQAVFTNWSDGGLISHQINLVANTPVSITGTFKTQYQLTTSANPSIGGTVTPPSGNFYDSGTVVAVLATPNPNYAFASWSGDVADTSNANTTVTMNAPLSVVANFALPQPVTITVPAGIQFSLNGTSYTGTQTVNLVPGSYPLTTSSPQAQGAGAQAVFVSWSDNGNQTHTISVGNSPVNITGNFKTQYQLTTAVSPLNGGSVSPANGNFYDSGTVVNTVATPGNSYAFVNWTGNVAAANTPSTTVAMTGPQSITANFALIPPMKAVIGDPIVCNGIGGFVTVNAELTNPNVGGNLASTFQAVLDPGLTALNGTCVASSGTCTVTSGGQVDWQGTLAGGQTVKIQYQALVANGTPANQQLCVNSKGTVGGAMATVQACGTANCPANIPNTPQVNVGVSAQRPGSVLVYPYYTAKAGNQSDTRLTISNVGTTEAVVHMFFLDGSSCQQADFFLCLTPNASLSFKASEYDPETTGWLLAVAVDRQGRPVRNNTLVGNAFVSDGNYVDNYGAESFFARSDNLAVLGGNTARLLFNDVGYDAMPDQFSVEVQSPVDVPGQRLVTVGMLGEVTTGQLFGALQVGAGLVINGNESPAGSFVSLLQGSCQAFATISTTNPRVPGGMSKVVPSGQSGILRFSVGAGVGLLMAPRGAPKGWSGIRPLHKTHTTYSTITIPVLEPVC